MEAVLVAAKNDYRLILGASDFLTLLLSVEDYNSSCENGEHYDCIANANNDMDDDGDMSATGYYAVMTRDALVASAFHYCDCVMARDAGIYEIISDWMRSTSTRSGMSEKKNKKTTKKGRDTVFILDGDSHADKREGQYLLLPSLVGKEESDMHVLDDESCMFRRDPGVTVDVGGTLIIDEGDEHGNCTDQDVSKDTLVTVTSVEDMGVQTMNNSFSIEAYGEDVVGLSQSLARVKQAEIMSHSVLPSKFSRVSPSPTDAASIRGLLLSMSENWRALAIRSSASLYRLRGLLRHEQQARLMMFGGTNEARDEWVEGYSRPQILREAREALYVYAPLAGRLGMHRLKGELENTAFMVLYHRQYNSAMDIYEKSGAAIQSVTDYLSENIEMTLKNDEWLSPQLERLTVTSRVKKPYSLWRKLLKVKKRSTLTMQKLTSGSSISLVTDPNTLSITSVQDAIAIRVILKAKRLVDFDKDEDVRSREEFLCYYIQNRLMQIWPAIDAKRIKDYISNPKPNGYQSLHHTSKCFRYGHYWPFEVQIRTEDMHTKSEYGVAAHWDYKLKGLGRGRHNEVHMPLLDSAMDTKQDFSDISQKVNINTIETIVRDNILATSSRTGEDRGLGSLTRSSTLQSYIKALSTARQHLLDKSIFVFYSTLNSDSMEGKVLGLPVGSTVYDALVGICKRCNLTVPPDSLDDSKFDAFVNGSKASLQDALNTGDTLVFPSLECRVVKYL
jgi:ppGpp synthetase/RelA/SpoT-type nucleotidyltranferase